VLIAIVVIVQLVAWWLVTSAGIRLGVLGLTLLVLPVVRLMIFERR